jgi:hypothetical protein
VSYCALLVVLTAIGLYLAFKRGDIIADMPVGQQLKTEKHRKIVGLVFRGIALAMAITAILMFANISKPLLSYTLGRMPASTEAQVIDHIDSAAMPGAFYFHMTIKTEDNTSLSFWYPDQILQAGHKYIFMVLPGSDFAFSARAAD